MRININNITLLFITTFIMFLGNLMTMSIFIDPYEVENKWVFIFVYCFLLFLFVYKYKVVLTKEKIFVFLLWEIFIITVFLSNYYHGNFVLLEFITYSIMIPSCFFSARIIKYKKFFLISYIFSVIPFLYVVDHPENSLGILFCIAGTVLLNLINLNKASSIYIYLTIIFTSILIYLTQSRTSLVTFLFVAFLQIFIIIIKDNSSLLSIIRKTVILFSLFIILYIASDHIANLIFGKWEGATGDITSGRLDIWLNTIRESQTMFGNGTEFFLLFSVRDAHNIFIQVLGAYGVLSLSLFILLFIYFFYKSIRLRRSEYLLFFTSYFLLGMSENTLFIDNRLIAIHLLFFMYLGCLMNESRLLPQNNLQHR